MPNFNDKRLARPNGQSTVMQVTAGVVAVRETPAEDGRLATVALHGEILDAFEEVDGFAHVQCQRDRYVGWADVAALSAPVRAPTHKVSALRTYCYSEPDLKSAPHFLLSLGARVVATDRDGDWVACARAGYVHTRHLTTFDQYTDDPTSVAERLIGTPYLWGGRESLGLDCTGLSQTAFEAAGVLLPRDSDMQFAWAGEAIDDWRAPGALQRGDLVFWQGHCGLMANATELIHANAWHMAVVREPLSEAITRIARLYADPIGARRVNIAKARARLPDWMHTARV